MDDLFVKANTNETCLWLTVNNFPKSQMFTNVNMFKLLTQQNHALSIN